MPQHKISGVWKDAQGVITHYAVHTVNQSGGIPRAVKTSKANAVSLLESPGNTAITWIWNYNKCGWDDGEVVQVIPGVNGKYLRSNPDNKLTDNLAHLINFDWITI